MNCKSLLFCACFASLLSSTPAATVIKILHINPQAKVRAIWQESAQGFESAHPGVKVEFDYLENEAFKAKLPTLLQSKDRPSIFHSWGGGVMVEQIGSGICQDITQRITEDGFKDTFYPAAVQNFSFDGKYYGLPNDVAPEVLFYNKELCQKAGVDPTQIHYWEDLIEAVKKCKAAGITPMAVGGKDKWPLHFYTALLMMRILGKDGMQAVIEDKNGGFTNPEVLQAFQLYKDFTTLEPFQKGYLANSYAEAAGTFHDGKTAFHLMGTWDLTEGRANATDKQGLPNEKLGFIFFPAVKGGKGKATDMLANLNGWLIAKEAPKETIDFAKVWLGKEAQTKIAQQGLGIPALKGTADAIQDPLLKEIAEQIERSEWLESPMDQILGPDMGLLDSYWGVILPQIAFNLGFAIVLLQGFFAELPHELFEAAFVDGCSYPRMFWQITLPLSRPILATVGVLSLVGSWNEYLLPLVMINNESLYPWPLGIMQYQGQYGTDWGKVLAFVSLTLTPAVIFYLMAQKHIIAGLTSGAVKG